MDEHNTPAAIFKEYAQKVLKEQSAEVQKKYRNREGVKKSLRLKIFNEHLDILKERLQNKLSEIIKHSGINTAKDKMLQEKRLNIFYDECISSFLKKGFDL